MNADLIWNKGSGLFSQLHSSFFLVLFTPHVLFHTPCNTRGQQFPVQTTNKASATPCHLWPWIKDMQDAQKLFSSALPDVPVIEISNKSTGVALLSLKSRKLTPKACYSGAYWNQRKRTFFSATHAEDIEPNMQLRFKNVNVMHVWLSIE